MENQTNKIMSLGKECVGKYVIIDIRTMDYMKNSENMINVYDTQEEALEICWMYEFENAWVMKLVYNHIEDEINCT